MDDQYISPLPKQCYFVEKVFSSFSPSFSIFLKRKMNFFYYYCQGFGFCHIAIDKKNKQLNRTPNPQLKRKKTNKKKDREDLQIPLHKKHAVNFSLKGQCFGKL